MGICLSNPQLGFGTRQLLVLWPVSVLHFCVSQNLPKLLTNLCLAGPEFQSMFAQIKFKNFNMPQFTFKNGA